jgi:hypothetical protein
VIPDSEFGIRNTAESELEFVGISGFPKLLVQWLLLERNALSTQRPLEVNLLTHRGILPVIGNA